MYIGDTDDGSGLHHMVYEALDNAIDEALAGHAKRVEVILHPDGSAEITDDGRGVPTDIHEGEGISAAEVIMTQLHAGGKFDQNSYKVSGGLHGVGASVVNALSRQLVAIVRRDGSQYRMEFSRGNPVSKLQKAKATVRGNGTTITFTPDPTIFPKTEFEPETIRHRIEVVSYLHRGLKITFADETSGKKESFQHERGLVDYLGKILQQRSARAIHETPWTFARDDEVRIELVLQWTESTDEHVRSYVNGIPTGSGGTHENGLRAGIGKAIRNYIETHNLSPKGVTLTADDIREGMVGVLSIFITEPQFQGQTKDKLNNPELTAILDSMVRPALEVFGKVFVCGDRPGLAQSMKLANNFLSATGMAASSEAIAMGVKAGLDPSLMCEVINAGSGMNTSTTQKFPRSVLPGTFDYGFGMALMVKDVRLFLAEAESFGIPVEVAQAVGRLWEKALAENGPDSDFTTLAKTVEKGAGIEMRAKKK